LITTLPEINESAVRIKFAWNPSPTPRNRSSTLLCLLFRDC
jgi:hypothetical protein